MAYTKYSLTPANNTATPPDGAPEGMLPSAVNDTMRDMMAQIRDCGDGIRDGTYTMTAAKITGGTITGITDLAIADGGTGASTAAGARTNLGLDGFVNMKNRIINGTMAIAQRGTSAVADGFMVDRFQAYEDTAGVFSWQQVADAPAGFVYSSKCTITTANGSPSSSNIANFQHIIEGNNVADLGWGTASAKTVTLSFWVKSSLTGNFGASILNSAVNRSYPFLYSISSANTWEYKTVTIAGDTSGTWLTDNGIGLRIMFNIGGGSNVLGTANTWAGARYDGATGSTNIFTTLNATWFITGVQLEVGSTATSFDYRPYGTELALCQRYYETGTIPTDGLAGQYAANAYNGNQNGFNCMFIPFTVKKRTSPTVPTVTSNGSWVIAGDNAFSATSNHTFVANNISVDAVRFISNRISGNSTPTAGNVYMWEANFTYTASAEL